MDPLTQGNSLFVDEDYQAALEYYAKAIEHDKSNADAYLKRASAHLKLEQFKNAYDDATTAITLAPNSPLAYLRQGMALFELEDYENAKQSFEKGLGISPDHAQLKMWNGRCDAEINMYQTQPTVLSSTPTPTPTSKETVTQEPQTKSQIASTPQSASPEKKAPPRFRHEWYQGPSFVYVTVFAKKIPKESITIDIMPRELDVCIKLDDSNEFNLDLELFDEVVPDLSKWSHFSTKIEIKLKKKVDNDWSQLERDQAQESLAKPQISSHDDTSADFKPSYPSSSRKRINWDKLDAELSQEIEKEKPQGDEALNKLFQQIYSQGDEDTRRAMVKSFTESGGTVLSTNWKDVGKKKIDPSPPEGMEARKWE